MKNDEEKWFTWSVLGALNLKERDNERKDKKLKAEEEKLGVAPVALLNMIGIDYPVSQKEIDKFDKTTQIFQSTSLGMSVMFML